jgi:hypothetical protein
MPEQDRSKSAPRRDPEEEGSAAKRRQRANPADTDPEEEGSSARPQR